MTTTPHHARIGLLSLPDELFNFIICDLLGSDLKALRLADKRHNPAICRILFRRVRLSILKTDRQHFLDIAVQPHLACNVRILEWIAFPTSPESFGRWVAPITPEAQMYRPSTHIIAYRFSQASWIRVDADVADTINILRRFAPDLDAALRAMHSLDMLEIRRATYDDTEQFVHARRCLSIPSAVFRWKDLCAGKHAVIIEYLQNAVKEHSLGRGKEARDVTINICPGEETAEFKTTSIIRLYGTIHSQSFEHLTDVGLDTAYFYTDKMVSVAKTLLSATGLRVLSLYVGGCLKNGTVPSEINTEAMAESQQAGAVFLSWFKGRRSGWNTLYSFSMRGLHVPAAALGHFVGLHSDTLKKLVLCPCAGSQVTIAHVQALASFNGLKLNQLVLHTWMPAVAGDKLLLGHSELLAYINECPGGDGVDLVVAETRARLASCAPTTSVIIQRSKDNVFEMAQGPHSQREHYNSILAAPSSVPLLSIVASII
ncbi:hypothetical protein MN608_11277 [Microdochium nivale]|nr:hypothetical protein MN608_11277 [Microdochium nivale]